MNERCRGGAKNVHLSQENLPFCLDIRSAKERSRLLRLIIGSTVHVKFVLTGVEDREFAMTRGLDVEYTDRVRLLMAEETRSSFCLASLDSRTLRFHLAAHFTAMAAVLKARIGREKKRRASNLPCVDPFFDRISRHGVPF